MYETKILADSLAPSGVRLTTFEVTFPRIVLAEFNTHRLLARNSASSRAIPVEKRIAAVDADPFIPEAFGKNQRGMQSGDALTGDDDVGARVAWRRAMTAAIGCARELAAIGVHKQLANRLIEPFVWHTVIVTATEWSNFFALRCHPAAQPEIQRIARDMRHHFDTQEPAILSAGDWHLPMIDWKDEVEVAEGMPGVDLRLVSIGRCARVSYMTHDGRRDFAEDMKLANRLRESGHMSPFEHVAQALSKEEWESEGKRAAEDWIHKGIPVGNLRGWRQYRKTLENEHDFGALGFQG